MTKAGSTIVKRDAGPEAGPHYPECTLYDAQKGAERPIITFVMGKSLKVPRTCADWHDSGLSWPTNDRP